MKKTQVVFSEGLEKATGKIDYGLANDVVIHSAVQNSDKVLRGLVCSLMGLKESEVKSVLLLNPIDFRTYTAKEIIFDIKVIMNDEQMINVEIQISIGKRRPWRMLTTISFTGRERFEPKRGKS